MSEWGRDENQGNPLTATVVLDQFHSCCNADIAKPYAIRENALEHFHCYCNAGFVLSHPSYARMGHPDITLTVKSL